MWLIDICLTEIVITIKISNVSRSFTKKTKYECQYIVLNRKESQNVPALSFKFSELRVTCPL